MIVSMDKEYRTPSGRAVRIYAVDGVETYSVHGAIRYDSGWEQARWTCSGEGAGCCPNLIEVKPRIKRTVWLNMYPHNGAELHSTRSTADEQAKPARIACVPIEIDCEEGEGL
jgi:hypothetical protein